MSKRRNGNILRKMVLDEIGLSRDSPDYKANWARVDRRIDKIPDQFYNEFANQIDDIKKNVKIFLL